MLYTKPLASSYGVHIFCSQCDSWLCTISVATVRLVHNFKIVANNGHILNIVYKNGSKLFHHVESLRKLCRQRWKQNVPWVHYCTQNTVGDKSVYTLFPMVATFLATFANRGHNSSLDEFNTCTQTHVVSMYAPASPSDEAVHIHRAYVPGTVDVDAVVQRPASIRPMSIYCRMSLVIFSRALCQVISSE